MTAVTWERSADRTTWAASAGGVLPADSRRPHGWKGQLSYGLAGGSHFGTAACRALRALAPLVLALRPAL